MEVKYLKEVKTDASTIEIYVKCTDYFCGTIKDKQDNILRYFDDTGVPSFFPGNHYGEYIDFKIDLDTGKILNWKKLEASNIEEYINKGKNE